MADPDDVGAGLHQRTHDGLPDLGLAVGHQRLAELRVAGHLSQHLVVGHMGTPFVRKSNEDGLPRAVQPRADAHPRGRLAHLAVCRCTISVGPAIEMLREMTCDPRFRKALITDGKTEVGQAHGRSVIKAGADIVWVGQAEPWKKFPGLDEFAAVPQGRWGRSTSPIRVRSRSWPVRSVAVSTS